MNTDHRNELKVLAQAVATDAPGGPSRRASFSLPISQWVAALDYVRALEARYQVDILGHDSGETARQLRVRPVVSPRRQPACPASVGGAEGGA